MNSFQIQCFKSMMVARSMAVTLLMWLLISCLACQLFAEQPFRPEPGKFPPIEKAKSYRGELVFVDHVNRRGSLRLHIDEHFQEGKLHHFAMLPYGIIRYRGAPAELREIPIGTVLYGKFFLPPDPKTSAVPVVKGKVKTAPPENHAILLEDGPSLCMREGKRWKLQELNMGDSQGELVATLKREKGGDGLGGQHNLTLDHSTRVWRGRELLGIDDLVKDGSWPAKGTKKFTDQAVHLALAWHPKYLYQRFHVSDIWLDEKAMNVSSERVRQRHIRHIRTRWMPAWVDSIDYGDFGKAKITVTLFGGMDKQLLDDFKPGIGGKMAAAENTLRTWWPDHDGMDGKIIAVEKTEKDPPLGSSGIQVQFEVPLILEGFRPGRIVRLRPQNWPNVKPPVEERIRNFEDRWPSHDIFKK